MWSPFLRSFQEKWKSSIESTLSRVRAAKSDGAGTALLFAPVVTVTLVHEAAAVGLEWTVIDDAIA